MGFDQAGVIVKNLRKGIALPITTYIVYTDSRQLSRDKLSPFQLTDRILTPADGIAKV